MFYHSLFIDTESHLYETVEIRQDSHEYLVAKPYESNSEPSNSLSMLSTNSVPTGPPPALPAPPAPPAPPPLPLLLPKLPKSRAEPQKLLYKPGVDLRDCIQINNCVVRLLLGDISEHPADVLVNSSGEYDQYVVSCLRQYNMSCSNWVMKYTRYIAEDFISLARFKSIP